MTDIQDAVQLICEEKNISVESVLETIEAALAAAYRKEFGNKKQNIKVSYDLAANKMEIFDVKTVVEDIDLEELETQRQELEAKKEAGEEVDEEEFKRFNPKTEMMLAEAKELDAKAEIGQELKIKLEVPGEFGRMAAQTAKQVIIQRLREAERETIFNEFKEKEGQLFNVVVQRREGRNVYCDINKAMAILPPDEQMFNEQYNSGQRLKAILISIARSARGPEMIVSRAHPDLLKELFKMEVPEIAAGAVEIKSVAREAGARSKIAVMSHEDNIDPVGSCVGQRGTRVQTVINELSGEKIDIIEWSDNVETFIANSLSPAKISSIKIDEKNKTAKVSVKEEQLSLAIGKSGQNVRLAAKLSGWKIDIEGAEKVLDESSSASDDAKATPAKKATDDKEEVKDKKDETSKTNDQKIQKDLKDKTSPSAKAIGDKEEKEEKFDDQKPSQELKETAEEHKEEAVEESKIKAKTKKKDESNKESEEKKEDK
ncbi:transcription termination factor NusA [Patescibacteria group bacterium]|nr:transcription termination factor NusA [Patescibacteria group bacterium]